ncbi:heparan-sulfate 6-O-sulfotransferase 3-B [Aplysia californica]|uniref:Heparan-sulfate 6-O-sulfotransferase n=1 Tax=Aplysia californica TaxID=6500 RepID=A0ABM0K2F7_APLCA|nr:heparan-sulfate 6-O-sulfotransferase 3-B [Aplysia californica]
MLRDAVTRFLSEWKHVSIGAHWQEVLQCDGSRHGPRVPRCYRGKNWMNVSLVDFMACKSNLAFNRQTRMLANLSLSDCYRKKSNLSLEQRDEIMLASAKYNLAKFFRFFGLQENEFESARLFEATFPGIKFKQEAFMQNVTTAQRALDSLTDFERKKILRLNHLDVRLLQFARALFLERLKRVKIGVDPDKAQKRMTKDHDNIQDLSVKEKLGAQMSTFKYIIA